MGDSDALTHGRVGIESADRVSSQVAFEEPACTTHILCVIFPSPYEEAVRNPRLTARAR